MIINVTTQKNAHMQINFANNTLSVKSSSLVDEPIIEWGYTVIDGEAAHTAIISAGKIAIPAKFYKLINESKSAHLEQLIPGLAKLSSAISEQSLYETNFESALDSESNDGAMMPKHPKHDVETLKATYPRATIYLAAQSYTAAANDRKAAAGDKAVAMLESGASIDDAKAVLNQWADA